MTFMNHPYQPTSVPLPSQVHPSIAHASAQMHFSHATDLSSSTIYYSPPPPPLATFSTSIASSDTQSPMIGAYMGGAHPPLSLPEPQMVLLSHGSPSMTRHIIENTTTPSFLPTSIGMTAGSLPLSPPTFPISGSGFPHHQQQQQQPLWINFSSCPLPAPSVSLPSGYLSPTIPVASFSPTAAMSQPTPQTPQHPSTATVDGSSFVSPPAALSLSPLPVSRADSQSREATLQVYSAAFRSVLTIPLRSIHQLPAARLQVTRLVLCSHYKSLHGNASCPMGTECKFVHADVTDKLSEHDVHVNYAWTSLEAVTYERFPPGQIIEVLLPNSRAVERLPTHHLLKTKCLTGNRRQFSHCAHYYYNRTCNLGSDCGFVHAVSIDSTAKPHQRAPVPSRRDEGCDVPLASSSSPSNTTVSPSPKCPPF